MDDNEVIEALNTIFHADTGIYRQRGFQRKVGYGKRPALVTSISPTPGRGPGTPFPVTTWT